MAIDVEVGHVAVQPLAYVVCQPTDREDVGRGVEHHALVRTKPLLSQYFGCDRLQARIVGPKGMGLPADGIAALAELRRLTTHTSMIPEPA